MWEFLVRGGIVMVPIAVASVVGVGVFLERLWYLQRGRIIPEAFVARIEKLIAGERVDDALLLCQENDTPIAHVLAAALRNTTRPRERIKEAVEEVGKFQSTNLERYVEVVGTVAAIEPLLGLLGTVIGMISVFQQVETFGLGDPSSFASGIWEALITTAAGLSVAIPTYLAYKLLLSRVDQLLVEMEERSLRVIDMVARD